MDSEKVFIDAGLPSDMFVDKLSYQTVQEHHYELFTHFITEIVHTKNWNRDVITTKTPATTNMPFTLPSFIPDPLRPTQTSLGTPEYFRCRGQKVVAVPEGADNL